MESGQVDEIRWLESTILDQHFKKLPLYNFSEDIVIPYLLKTFGDFERARHILSTKGYADQTISRILVTHLHGLGHAIRWTYQSGVDQPIGEVTDHDQANEMSAEAITWAINYYRIAQNFVAWSRNLLTAEINKPEKWLRFFPKNTHDGYRMIANQFQEYHQAQELYDSLHHSLMNQEFQKWLTHIDLHEPPIYASMKWDLARKSPLYEIFLQRVKAVILPECTPETDLGGYTLDDFRRLYTALSLNFLFICWVEGITDQLYGEDNPFGANPIKLEWRAACIFFAEVTALSQETVAAIFTDLTFDHRNFHTSLIVQPLVRSTTNYLYILPNYFSFVDPNRMLTGALNKGSKKRIYDKLINQIEQYQVTKLVTLFEQMGMSVFREPKVKIMGNLYTPDLIVINGRERQVLILDYKHFLSPIGPAEVSYRIKEVDKAIEQVNNYMRQIPSSHFMLEATRDEPSGLVYTGLILFNTPMAVPLPANLELLITDLFSFDQLLGLNDSYQLRCNNSEHHHIPNTILQNLMFLMMSSK